MVRTKRRTEMGYPCSARAAMSCREGAPGMRGPSSMSTKRCRVTSNPFSPATAEVSGSEERTADQDEGVRQRAAKPLVTWHVPRIVHAATLECTSNDGHWIASMQAGGQKPHITLLKLETGTNMHCATRTTCLAGSGAPARGPATLMLPGQVQLPSGCHQGAYQSPKCATRGQTSVPASSPPAKPGAPG